MPYRFNFPTYDMIPVPYLQYTVGRYRIHCRESSSSLPLPGSGNRKRILKGMVRYLGTVPTVPTYPRTISIFFIIFIELVEYKINTGGVKSPSSDFMDK